jgi:hypothetical protein
LCRYLGGKVQLVIADIPKNLSNILVWNWKVDGYIVAVFDFTNKFLASNGVVLLFHHDDFKIMEVKSHLESHDF